MKITYFSIEGAPGRYFVCAPYRSTMSTASCAAMYAAEKGSHAGRHLSCNGCPIGAHHAGEKPVAAPGLFGSLICPRCHRGSNRLVRGLCVSCLNRQYEIVRGVNAKGKAPTRLAPLAPMSIAAMEDGGPVVVDTELSANRLEVILRALRSRPGARSFGRRGGAIAPMLAQGTGDLFEVRHARV